MRLLFEALTRTPNEAKLHFVFDRQNIMESRAVQTFHEIIGMAGKPEYITQPNAEKLGTITYQSSKDEPALQAADLLVHLWYGYFTKGYGMSLQKLMRLTGLTVKKDTLSEIDYTSLDRDLTRQITSATRKKIQEET